MALLVISKNTIGSTLPLNKRPGFQLAESLKHIGVFSLLDVPSFIYLTGAGGRLKILNLYLRAALELIRYRNQEIFFYNCPIAYVFLYLIALLCRFQRPSLLLADGLNCIGMRYSPALFLKFFRRVISLPYNEVIQGVAGGPANYIWFPGFSNFNRGRPRDFCLSNETVRLLFNSSLLPNNEPEWVLTLSRQYSWMEIIVTDTESNFRNYLSNMNVPLKEAVPENLQFVGVLPFWQYEGLVASIDGILLCRNELLFSNTYNFPSKVIEALQTDIAIISLYPISHVADNLYYLLDPCNASVARVQAHIDQMRRSVYLSKRREFLDLCDVGRLHRWVSADV